MKYKMEKKQSSNHNIIHSETQGRLLKALLPSENNAGTLKEFFTFLQLYLAILESVLSSKLLPCIEEQIKSIFIPVIQTSSEFRIT